MPLEYPDLADEQFATNLAMYVRQGKMGAADIEEKIAVFKFGINLGTPGYADPRVIEQNRFFHENYCRAMEILKECPTLEAVMEKQETGYAQRREAMATLAGLGEPGLIVVGFGHSPAMHKSLHAYDYGHILTPQAEEYLNKGESK